MSIDSILRLGDDTLLHNVIVSFKCKKLQEHEEKTLELRVNSFELLSEDNLKISFRLDDFQYVSDYLDRISYCDITFLFYNSKFERSIKYIFGHCQIIKKVPSVLNCNNVEGFSYNDNSKPLILDVLFKFANKYEGF